MSLGSIKTNQSYHSLHKINPISLSMHSLSHPTNTHHTHYTTTKYLTPPLPSSHFLISITLKLPPTKPNNPPSLKNGRHDLRRRRHPVLHRAEGRSVRLREALLHPHGRPRGPADGREGLAKGLRAGGGRHSRHRIARGQRPRPRGDPRERRRRARVHPAELRGGGRGGDRVQEQRRVPPQRGVRRGRGARGRGRVEDLDVGGGPPQRQGGDLLRQVNGAGDLLLLLLSSPRSRHGRKSYR